MRAASRDSSSAFSASSFVGHELTHAEVMDDQERDGGPIGAQIFAGTVERRVGDLFEEHVGLAVDHAVPLLDGGPAERLRQMAFASARWAE